MTNIVQNLTVVENGLIITHWALVQWAEQSLVTSKIQGLSPDVPNVPMDFLATSSQLHT